MATAKGPERETVGSGIRPPPQVLTTLSNPQDPLSGCMLTSAGRAPCVCRTPRPFVATQPRRVACSVSWTSGLAPADEPFSRY